MKRFTNFIKVQISLQNSTWAFSSFYQWLPLLWINASPKSLALALYYLHCSSLSHYYLLWYVLLGFQSLQWAHWTWPHHGEETHGPATPMQVLRLLHNVGQFWSNPSWELESKVIPSWVCVYCWWGSGVGEVDRKGVWLGETWGRKGYHSKLPRAASCFGNCSCIKSPFSHGDTLSSSIKKARKFLGVPEKGALWGSQAYTWLPPLPTTKDNVYGFVLCVPCKG
jgi:hypothetical protein